MARRCLRVEKDGGRCDAGEVGSLFVRCWRMAGVVGFVVEVDGVVWWRFGGGVVFWSKITIAKEKRLFEDHSPYKSHIFPLYNGMR